MRPQRQRVVRAARAHAVYIRKRGERDDSDSEDGPEDEDGWLYEDLGVLIRLYAQLRDREQMIELIFEVSRQITCFGMSRVLSWTGIVIVRERQQSF